MRKMVVKAIGEFVNAMNIHPNKKSRVVNELKRAWHKIPHFDRAKTLKHYKETALAVTTTN